MTVTARPRYLPRASTFGPARTWQRRICSGCGRRTLGPLDAYGGQDACIAELPGVAYACCAHGGAQTTLENAAYIAFAAARGPELPIRADHPFRALRGRLACVAFDERQLWHGARDRSLSPESLGDRTPRS